MINLSEIVQLIKKRQDILKAFLFCLLLAFIFVFIPYLLVLIFKYRFDNIRHITLNYTIVITTILPWTQGYILGSRLHYRSSEIRYLLSLFILIVDLLFAAFVLKEGIICLIMASPFILAVVMLGTFLGTFFSRKKRSKTLQLSILPLVVLAVMFNTAGPPPSFKNAISDAVTVNAPPERVWRYIAQYPQNNDPLEYWLWKVGLPAPIQSVAAEPKIGASRQCRFTKGVVFEEEITEFTSPKVLTFKVTRQPDNPEILGHFSLDKGQIYLEPNPDGTTTIVATSWYTLFVSPAFYFDWWAADNVRNVHYRVLNHIKRLAEADTQ